MSGVPLRVAFMGSGGLGGYFGARLCQGGAAEVHFIARGRHLEAMRREGLRVEGPNALHIPHVNATDDPAAVGIVDFVMVGVKLWDTEAALAQIRPMVGPDTTIISFQNGVLKDQYLREAFDASRLMGGRWWWPRTPRRP
jgi:2-dehydropantoate 2-reductase